MGLTDRELSAATRCPMTQNQAIMRLSMLPNNHTNDKHADVDMGYYSYNSSLMSFVKSETCCVDSAISVCSKHAYILWRLQLLNELSFHGLAMNPSSLLNHTSSPCLIRLSDTNNLYQHQNQIEKFIP